MDLSLKIDTIDGINEQELFREYFQRQKPVIIKGLLDGTEAGRLWSIEYMKQKLGHVTVEVYDNTLPKITAYTHGDLTMPFHEFADHITRPEKARYRLFLFDGFKHDESLRKEFPCPGIFKGLLGKIGFMFFGGVDTHVRMHYDIDMSNVLHTQFTGRKRILLFAPEYNDLLYKTPFNTFSIADFANPDYDKFPGLKYVKGYDITLEHGDSLFMPSGYWHYMMYQEGGFAVAYRKMAHSIIYKLQGLGNLTYRLWIDKLMSVLLGKRWLNYKMKLAHRRADKAITDWELREYGLIEHDELPEPEIQHNSEPLPHAA
ncbi:MAG: cupin-like domain-containing protein [Bacteroidetes bacterium]|nr:cupin-like domain-containing protein [Bacteroidota bacterium]